MKIYKTTGSTLVERIKQIKNYKSLFPNAHIQYDIVCKIGEFPIDSFLTISEAKKAIKSISDYQKEIDGIGVRIYIQPISFCSK